MVNFDLLAADIVSGVWGTPATFNGFRVLAALLHGSQAVRRLGFVTARTLFNGGQPNCGLVHYILHFLRVF